MTYRSEFSIGTQGLFLAAARVRIVTRKSRNLHTDANEANNRHDYQTAANLARRITSHSPQNGNAWNLLGISLLELNQFDAAAAALETAIKIDPASSFAYNNLGRVFGRQRKYEEAAAQFRKQIVINPQDHYAHGNLAMMLLDEKKCGEAMPELNKALASPRTNRSCCSPRVSVTSIWAICQRAYRSWNKRRVPRPRPARGTAELTSSQNVRSNLIARRNGRKLRSSMESATPARHFP